MFPYKELYEHRAILEVTVAIVAKSNLGVWGSAGRPKLTAQLTNSDSCSVMPRRSMRSQEKNLPSLIRPNSSTFSSRMISEPVSTNPNLFALSNTGRYSLELAGFAVFFCWFSSPVAFCSFSFQRFDQNPGQVCIFFLSVPGFQFGPVTVSLEAFSGHKTMMYTLKVGFTIVNNLIQHRGLDFHLILTVSRNYAGRRTDFRDKKSTDFSGENFLERFFWREITAREHHMWCSRAIILEKFTARTTLFHL